MKNNLLKFLTNNKEVRLYVVDVTDILGYSNIKEMETYFAKELYTKIFTCCSLLRGFLTERDQRLDINIRFKPEGYLVNCNIDGDGNIHCTFSSKLRVFDGEFKELVGKGATLSITRGGWMTGMFTGTTEISSDSIELCLSDFYSKSEQIDTVFKTWICNGIVRGCMIQPLPFAGSDSLAYVIDNIDRNQNSLSSAEWGKLPMEVFSYARVIEEYDIQTECGCSKEMFLGLLMSVETEDLKLSIKMDKGEELECGICGNKYLFDADDLKKTLKMKDGM